MTVVPFHDTCYTDIEYQGWPSYHRNTVEFEPYYTIAVLAACDVGAEDAIWH